MLRLACYKESRKRDFGVYVGGYQRRVSGHRLRVVDFPVQRP